MSNVSNIQTSSLAYEDEAISSVTEQFHQVNNLIPDDQELLSVPPDTMVSTAIKLMQENRFSQLPVKEGDQVLGVFSHRSFATHVANAGQTDINYGVLPVDEFIEPLRYVSVRDDIELTFEHLDRDDAVLVGRSGNAKYIVTAMDVLRYLYDITNLFVMLGEVELTLRRIINACIGEEELKSCIASYNEEERNKQEGRPRTLPKSLEDMTFNHYRLFIDKFWSRFEGAFGVGDWQRNNTNTKLNQVRILRNTVCHFKHETTTDDTILLSNMRFWLQNKAKAYEAKRIKNNDLRY